MRVATTIVSLVLGASGLAACAGPETLPEACSDRACAAPAALAVDSDPCGGLGVAVGLDVASLRRLRAALDSDDPQQRADGLRPLMSQVAGRLAQCIGSTVATQVTKPWLDWLASDQGPMFFYLVLDRTQPGEADSRARALAPSFAEAGFDPVALPGGKGVVVHSPCPMQADGLSERLLSMVIAKPDLARLLGGSADFTVPDAVCEVDPQRAAQGTPRSCPTSLSVGEPCACDGTDGTVAQYLKIVLQFPLALMAVPTVDYYPELGCRP